MVVVGDDTDAGFGLGTAFLAGGEVGGLLVFPGGGRGFWGDVVGQVGAGFDQPVFHLFVAKSTVATDEVKDAADGVFGFFDGSGEQFVVVVDVFEKFAVDDESFAILADEQGVAEFDFGSAFPAYDYLRSWFLVAREAASPDDAFVGLFFKGGGGGRGCAVVVNQLENPFLLQGGRKRPPCHFLKGHFLPQLLGWP